MHPTTEGGSPSWAMKVFNNQWQVLCGGQLDTVDHSISLKYDVQWLINLGHLSHKKLKLSKRFKPLLCFCSYIDNLTHINIHSDSQKRL